MIMSAAGLLLLLQAAMSPRPPSPPPERPGVTFRQHIIVRVPTELRRRVPASSSLIEWAEGRGPRCLSARAIRGASLLGPRGVDLLLNDGTRVRARLERRCSALDYYYGFYLDNTRDGRICADRDVIRSRSGGECEIDDFRSLKAEPRR